MTENNLNGQEVVCMCSNFILMTILNRISNHSYCHIFLECPHPHQIIEKEKLM